MKLWNSKSTFIKYALRFRNQKVLSDESLIWGLIMYFTAFTMFLYIHIYICICAWGSVYDTALKRLKCSVTKAIPMQKISSNRPDRFFLQNYEAHKNFILYILFKVICNGKHLHFINKMNQHSFAHNYETRSNVEKCFTTPFYLESKCQNSFNYEKKHEKLSLNFAK